MHIPDGLLDGRTVIALGAASALAVGVACRRARSRIGERHVPLLGVVSAFVFAAQMINFPVAGGTTGHFMGAALVSILLGPFGAVLVMTTVLAIQCFLFQDGGLTALGANIFNMGVVGGAVGFGVAEGARRLFGERIGLVVGGFLGAWLSILLASVACALEIAAKGDVSWRVTVPPMAAVHAVIGVGEGLITVSALAFLQRTRPDLLSLERM